MRLTGGLGAAQAGPTLRAELVLVAPFVLAALACWGGALAARRVSGPSGPPEVAPWQRSYLELSTADQRLYRELREGILEAENLRAATKQWPAVAELAEAGVAPFAPDGLTPALTWTRAQHGVYVNYLGVPADGAAGLTWLVLFIEPEPPVLSAKEPPPPVDEEHHTLPDGTALHVTVWTKPGTGAPAPSSAAAVVNAEVLAFPVAEGWSWRVGR